MRIHRSVLVVLALASVGGCDKIPGFGGGDEQAQADEPAPAADPAAPTVEPDKQPGDAQAAPNPDQPVQPVQSETTPGEQPATPGSTPEPVQPPPAQPSELDALLARVSGLADPKAATEPSVEQDNKTAWTHYKAKQWPEAAQFFARVAARDREWKHAHNLACALAKAGKPDDARIALAESFARGGDAARASAKKDGDLASVRELPWFAELTAAPAEPVAPSIREDEDEGDEDEELDEDEIAPPNCPPGVKFEDEHYCWYDTLAEWKFEAVAFATPVPLELEIPARPKNLRWKKAKGKIPWKELREALGIQHTIESEDVSQMPHLMEWSINVWDAQDEMDVDDDVTMPYFWWPEDNNPILVLPNRQKLGSRRFLGVILARKTDSGWMAVNVPVTIPKQLEGSTNSTFESSVVLRFDHFELFTLTQFVYYEGYNYKDGPPTEPFLCRIRWEQGKLQRACTESWTETGKSFG